MTDYTTSGNARSGKEKLPDRSGSKSQTEIIILRDELLGYVVGDKKFIEWYAGKQIFIQFSKVCGFILTNYITSQTIANFVNEGAQLLKKRKDVKFEVTFKQIAERISELIANKTIRLDSFNSIDMANTFNGLVKLFLYNKDLYARNIGQFKDIINNLVQKYFELLDRDNQNNWTVLYNIKYLQACGFKFSEEILSKIPHLKLDALDDDHTNTTLERDFNAFLSGVLKLKNKKAGTKNDCYEQEWKLIFKVGSASFQKSTDFYIEFTHDGKKYKTYIELDGPTHFENTEQTQKNPQTQIRDILNSYQLKEEQKRLLETGDETQILYLTLSAKDFNEEITEFNKFGNLTEQKIKLFKFLIQQNQLQQTPERTSDSSEITDEDKSADSSVKDVVSEMTDVNYTTPTPKSGVSELVQKAQEASKSPALLSAQTGAEQNQQGSNIRYTRNGLCIKSQTPEDWSQTPTNSGKDGRKLHIVRKL